MLLPNTTLEPHFPVDDLAKEWRVGSRMLRRLIREEEGLIRAQLGKKKFICRYSVPESVARRIHARLAAKGFVVTAA